MKLDLDKKIQLCERAGVEAALLKPDSIVTNEPGWFQVVTPSVQHPAYNVILLSSLSNRIAEQRVRETASLYQKLNVPYRWEISPVSQPKTLGSLLAACGMEIESEVWGMVAEPGNLILDIPSGVDVEDVNQKNAKDWVETYTTSWNFPKELSAGVLEDVLRNIQAKPQRFYYYLARHQGKGAGTAMLCIAKDSGYFMSTSVHPSFRGLGIYKALVAHRLKVLREKNISFATTQAITRTSAPIIKKLGFEMVFDMQVYRSTFPMGSSG